MGLSECVSVDGVSYPSKKAATIALHRQGIEPDDIADLIGSTPGAVKYAIRSFNRQEAAEPVAVEGWTEGKVEKAVRLFTACAREVAGALKVPESELVELWVKGRWPPQERGTVLEIVTPAAPVYLQTNEPPPASVFEPAEDDEPDRGDDEAELARLAQEEDAEEEQAPAAFPAPASRLIPPGGLFPAGHMVRLVRDDGKYLHESLQGFTDKREFAWDGTRQQYDAVRQQMPKVLAKLSMEVVI